MYFPRKYEFIVDFFPVRRAVVFDPPHRPDGVCDGVQHPLHRQGVPPAPAPVRGRPQQGHRQGRGKRPLHQYFEEHGNIKKYLKYEK